MLDEIDFDDRFVHRHHFPSRFGHWMKYSSLDELEEGDYGRVVIWAQNSEVLVYDDDHTECICRNNLNSACPVDWDSIEFPHDAYVCDHGLEACTKRRCRNTERHYLNTRAICYPAKFLYTMDFSMGHYTVDFDELRAFPVGYVPPVMRHISTRSGFLYAVAMNPDLSFHRIKFGWSVSPAERTQSFKSGCPRGLVLGLWDADKDDEGWLFQFISQSNTRNPAWGVRYGESEEFDLYDPFKTFSAIDQALHDYHCVEDAQRNQAPV